MRGLSRPAALVILISLAGAGASQDVRARLPQDVGACVATSIVRIGTHAHEGVAPRRPSFGHAVGYANAAVQVSLTKLPEIARSRVDDRVEMCLAAAAPLCFRGDAAGRLYRVTNERTRETWTLPDPYHRCTGS